MDFFFLQFFGVGGSRNKPKKFFSNTSPKDLFVSEEGKSVPQIIPHHSAEEGSGACFGSVYFVLSLLDNFSDKVNVLIFFMLRS